MSQPLENLQWGATEIKVDKSSYTWEIKNFSYAPSGTIYKSPLFAIAPMNGMDWYLDFYINGPYDKEHKGDIRICLNACRIPDFAFDLEYTVAVLDKRGRKNFKLTRKVHESTPEDRRAGKVRVDKIRSFVNRADIVCDEKSLLINDTLGVHCDFAFISSCNTSPVIFRDNSDKLNKMALDDLEKYLQEQELCDVTLKTYCDANPTRVESLKAHKFMLSARSPVFRAMFQTDMVEKKDSVVFIDDVDCDVLKELLRFVYAARVENLENLVIGLLDAAEKYQVEGLKDVCEDHLMRCVNVENVVRILILCNRYNLKDLKEQAAHLMKVCPKNVVRTDGFKSVRDPDLLAEIINILHY